MGCDFYVNKVLHIEYEDGDSYTEYESEIIDQTKYYKDDWEGMSMYNRCKNYELEDFDVYDQSEGWLISNDAKIKRYTKIVGKKGVSMENVIRLYISKDYVKN